MAAETALTALTVAAGLSLGIERSLEVLKHFMDYGNGRLNPGERDTLAQSALGLVEEAERAVKGGPAPDARSSPAAAPPPGCEPAAAPKPTATAAAEGADLEAIEKYPPPRIPVVPMEPLSTQDTGSALFFQFAAAGLGIIFAGAFRLRLLAVFGVVAPGWDDAFALADMVFTGLVIGGGSQPIHLLIRFISERKVPVAEERTVDEAEREVAQTRALARVVSTATLVDEKKETQPLQWVDFAYDGGVSPDRLDGVHVRSGPPNLVVYHHTAMSSVKSFQDVVDEFLVGKKWVTGYHCVVMPDGAIKPFCRWDRYGSHAAGLNDRSLGIAFHGNFHTLPGDAFSNADGRYGNQQPTEAQVHAGARVIALWAYLYPDIKLDFDRCILPHREAMPGHTVCPGSNFPQEQLEALVRQYHDGWSRSPQAQKGIEDFRKLAYVNVVPA